MDNPDDPDTKALAQSEAKRQEALERIDRARQLQEAGDADASQTEVTNAWYALDEALTICPSNHRARFLLVSCAMNAEDYARAKLEASSIYKDLSSDQLTSMGDSVLHLSIAHASKMLGEVDEAIRFAKEAAELYPNDPQPYMVLGELYEAIGRNQDAEQNCCKALAVNDSADCQHVLNPQNVFFTLCCLTSCLVRQARCTEAEKFALKAIQVDDTSPLAFRHLADVYHFQKRYDDALQACEKIRALDPEDREVLAKIDSIRADMTPQGDHEARSHRSQAVSLPRREADGPGLEQPLSEEARRAPPPASIGGQMAASDVARAIGSRNGSMRGGSQKGKLPDPLREDGMVSIRSRGSATRSGRKPEEQNKEGGWMCCMERKSETKRSTD